MKQKLGFSLMEMMISMVIMTMIMLAISPMLDISFKGITNFEITNNLKIANQTAINKIGHNLLDSQRIFDRTESDSVNFPLNNFLGRIDLAADGQPLPLAGSRLPVRQSTGTLSPLTPNYNPANAGNSLFFMSPEPPVSIDLAGEDFQFDIYKFNYYYLGQGSKQPIGGSSNRTLWEWHSIPYVDYGRLMEIANPATRELAIQALYNLGYRFAFDSTNQLVSSAFYILQFTGANWAATMEPGHTIRKASGGDMIKILTGVAMKDFDYGIAPNTSTSSITTPETFRLRQSTVPMFCTLSGEYPSGFEVVIIGYSRQRQVFTRIVMVAKGQNTEFYSNEQVLLSTVNESSKISFQ